MSFTMVVPNICWARSELDSRVTRLENIVDNELSSEMLKQLDAMQQEIRELRGKLEEQQNLLQSSNQKQEKLFLNLDARINKMDTDAEDKDVQVEAPQIIDELPANVSQKEVIGTSEKSLYESARSLMHNKKFAEAILEFKDFLWQFPEGTYACEANYWLGELYRMQWHANKADKNLLNHAIDSYNIVINKYQSLDREGDAMLKLALLEMEQEHLAVAKDIFLQVINKYPNTAIAKIAANNIDRIEQARIAN